MHLFVNEHSGCLRVLITVRLLIVLQWTLGVHVSFWISFVWIYAQEWDCWFLWYLHFQFFEGPLDCSPWWLHQFTSPPAVSEDCLFSPPSPAFVVCRFFSDRHSAQCEVPHCSCDSAVIASFFPSWKSSIVAASVTLSTDPTVCISPFLRICELFEVRDCVSSLYNL